MLSLSRALSTSLAERSRARVSRCVIQDGMTSTAVFNRRASPISACPDAMRDFTLWTSSRVLEELLRRANRVKYAQAA